VRDPSRSRRQWRPLPPRTARLVRSAGASHWTWCRGLIGSDARWAIHHVVGGRPTTNQPTPARELRPTRAFSRCCCSGFDPPRTCRWYAHSPRHTTRIFLCARVADPRESINRSCLLSWRDDVVVGMEGEVGAGTEGAASQSRGRSHLSVY